MFNWCHRYTSIKTSFFTLIPSKTLSRLPRGMSPGKVSWGYCHLLLKMNAQLSLTNPRDAKACPKLLKFDVKTSRRRVNNLLEVMEIRCLVSKILIQIASKYSSQYYLVSFILNNITFNIIVILVFFLSKYHEAKKL